MFHIERRSRNTLIIIIIIMMMMMIMMMLMMMMMMMMMMMIIKITIYLNVEICEEKFAVPQSTLQFPPSGDKTWQTCCQSDRAPFRDTRAVTQ